MNKKEFAPGAPRCGAYARTTGKPCRKVAMANGRCRNHGGKSPKGVDSARYKHGAYSKEVKDLKKHARNMDRLIREMLES